MMWRLSLMAPGAVRRHVTIPEHAIAEIEGRRR